MKSNLDDKHLLEQSSVWTLMLKYAVPSVVTVLFFGFQNLVDGMVVGNALGADALAGVNIVLPLYSLIMVLSIVVGVGSQTLVSLELGAQRYDRAQDAMTTGFYALMAIAVLSSGVLYLFLEDCVRLLGANDRLVPYAVSYLRGLVPFTLPVVLCFYSDAMLKALGHPRLSMVIMSSIVVLNILLSLCFVVWLDWGVAGASIATGLAFSVGLAVSAAVTFSPRQRLSMLAGQFCRSLFVKAFYNGSSEGVSELASAVSIVVVNWVVVSRLGADGVAAFTAINYINFTGVLLFLGISDGLIPVLSYNYGAGRYNRIQHIFRFTLMLNMAIGVVVFLILKLWGDEAIGLFFRNQEHSSAMQIAREGLEIFAFVFLMNGVNVLVTSFFTSLGDARRSMVVALLRGLVFVVGGVLLLPLVFDIKGIWLTMPLAEGLTLLVSLVLLRRVWRTMSEPRA